MNKISTIILGVVLLLVLIAGGFYVAQKTGPKVTEKSAGDTVATTAKSQSSGIDYTNEDYGFSISLPDSWKGFSVISDNWEGYSLDNQGQGQVMTESGPLISVRHPDWEYKSPRQDIPIMVFTISEWNDMQNDKFHIGAAPINPSELGRNSKYVFALPARYNFAYLPGYEEVDQIIQNKSFKAF